MMLAFKVIAGLLLCNSCNVSTQLKVNKKMMNSELSQIIIFKSTE